MSGRFDSFSSMSYEQWLELAAREISSNINRQWENATIPRYFNRENTPADLRAFDNRPGNTVRMKGEVRSWDNVAVIHDQKVKNANSRALNSLMEGADGILFRNSADFDVHQLLDDIMPDYASISFSESGLNFAASYKSWLEHHDADHNMVRGYLHLPKEELPDMFRIFSNYSGVRFVHFHLELTENNFSSQLADFCLEVCDIIENLGSRNIAISDIWNRLSVAVDCGPLFFEEIARLRAIRILCYKMFRAYGLENITPDSILSHALSVPWNPEAYQPHANMLKGCTTGLAAILGGSNLVSILPENPDSELQQRIARNTNLILREECYLNKVLDPCAGSGYIEYLTDLLARNAWGMLSQENK